MTICVQVPEKVVIKLQELEDKYGIRKEDLIARAITKLIYEEVK
jgi:sulfur transfer complex TusBCD TusB component (DsrH family)